MEHPPGAGLRGRLMPTNSRIRDRKSTRLNSSHIPISYAVFCLKKYNIVIDIVRVKDPVGASNGAEVLLLYPSCSLIWVSSFFQIPWRFQNLPLLPGKSFFC